jgi:hypothetical protein
MQVALHIRTLTTSSAAVKPQPSGGCVGRGGMAARRHGGMAAWRHGGMACATLAC